MKKTWIFATLISLIVLLFATVNVMASPTDTTSRKKTPNHTPTAQATERATDDGQHGKGNGKGNGNGQGNDQGNKPDKGKGKSQGKPSNYTGTIATVDATSLTLTLEDGSSVSFVLNGDTQIKIPTLHGSATPADLSAGEHVTVRASLDDQQNLVASMILLIPGKPEKIHRVGTVTDYQPDVSITIQDSEGSLFTFLLTPETKILPAERASLLGVGMRVTIIAPRDVAHGTLTAAGIVVHPAGSGGTGTPTFTATATATPTVTNTPTDTETPTAVDTATETATP
jgi:hypothetical protein